MINEATRIAQIDWVRVSANRLRQEAYMARPAAKAQEALKALIKLEMAAGQNKAVLEREVHAAQVKLTEVHVERKAHEPENKEKAAPVENEKSTPRKLEAKA